MPPQNRPDDQHRRRGPADGDGDPLARIGRRLVAAERARRHRRARRRVALGTVAGVALLAGAGAAALPGAGDPSRQPLDGAPAGARVVRLVLDVAPVELGRPELPARVVKRLTAHGIETRAVRRDRGRLVVELRSAGRREVTRAIALLEPSAARRDAASVLVHDWERSVLTPSGAPVARLLAARDPVAVRVSQGAGSPQTALSRAAAERLAERAGGGAAVVEALPSGAGGGPGPRAGGHRFVLRGAPILTERHVAAAVRITTGLGQPAVRIDLTADGSAAFRAASRTIAQRGQRLLLPGTPAGAAAQHFAVVLDGRLVAVPSVDPVRSPDGLDARRGVIVSGGFTARSAGRLAAAIDAAAAPPVVRLSVGEPLPGD